MYTEIGGKKEKNTGKEGQIKETGWEAKSNITWGERKFWSAGVHGVMWRSTKVSHVGPRGVTQQIIGLDGKRQLSSPQGYSNPGQPVLRATVTLANHSLGLQ